MIQQFDIKWKKIINIFGLILLLLLFEPGIFKEKNFQNIDTIYDILKIFFIFIIMLVYFIHKIKKRDFKKSIVLYALIIFQVYCGVITLLKNGDFVRFIGPAISSIAMLMLVELLINYNLFFTTLKKINMYFRICYIVNFFTIIAKIIFKSSGIHYICFLGIDNRFIFPFFAWMLSEALVDIHNNNKITKTSKIIFFLIEISLLLVQTTAAMVIFTIWIVPLFIKNKHLKKLLINKINVVFNSIFLLDILIVRYRLSYMFSNILNYFGKFPHISGRVLIWNNIFDFIVPNNFWLGIGMQSELYDMTYFGNKIGEVYSVNHAHNTYIDIIYRYGFIGVLIFITIICYLISTLKKEKQNKFILPILISFSIILLLGIFDTMIYPGLFFLIGIVYNIDKLNEQ